MEKKKRYFEKRIGSIGNDARTPMEMLEAVQREISLICGLLDSEPNTGAAVQIIRLK